MQPSVMLLLQGFLVLFVLDYCNAQVGLRTAPLTAPRARDNSNNSSLGLFSKWTGLDLRHKSNHSSNIESSLAAIFRGVAYGISTSTPSSTTTSTTTPRPTSSRRVPQDLPGLPGRNDDFKNPFLFSPGFEQDLHHKAVTDQRGVSSVIDHPIQTPYIESPNIGETGNFEDRVLDIDEIEDVEVVRADVGVGLSKVEWIRSLGTAWIVHVYCAAGLYSLLAMLALLWLARIHASTHLLPRGYYITLYLLMFLASFLRCVHLFHDPYGAERRLPEVLSIVVEELGWPCLTAGLAVVVLALVRAWRCPRLLPQKPLAPLALALLTAAHLLTSVAAHLTAALLPEHAAPLRAAARAVTAAWGGAVGIGGFLAVWRVGRAVGRHPGLLLVRLSRAPVEGSLPARHPRITLFRGSQLTVVASFGQTVLAGLHMYALVGPHYLFDIPPAYPWYWLAYQSTCRILEIIMWLLLGITAALTVGTASGKRQSQKGEIKLLSVLSCKHCGSCTSIPAQDKADEVFPAVCQTNQAVRNFTLQSCGKGVYQEALTQQPLTRRANTVKPAHKRPSIRKSATLHSATSDIQLLWNQGHPQNAVSSDASSRPSSMLFNDAGFVRFRMQVDPQQCVDEVLKKSLQNLDIQGEPEEATLLKKVPVDDPPTYDQSFFDNVPNKDGVKTPSKIKISPQFENHYDNAQFDQLLSNHNNSEIYFDGSHCRSEVASVTDCSSTDALSPVPAADNDWSKYASTCSSISAANSFDVRMYDDYEVSSYYNSPSPASSNVYASLHRTAPRTRYVSHWTVYGEREPAVHSYEARQAVEQLTALLAPHTSSASSQSDLHIDYLTDGSHGKHNRESDSDLCSSGSHQPYQRHDHDEKRSSPKSRCPPQLPPRHLNLHDVTPDSAVVLDYTGHTDEASGDDIDPTLPLQYPPHPRPGLLTKIVKNNFSLGNGGYSPLGSEDAFHHPFSSPHSQNLLLKQAQHQALQQRHWKDDKNERVRPCGHRPRRGLKDDPKPISPTKPSVHSASQHINDTHSQKRQFSLTPTSPTAKQENPEKLPSPVVDGTTQTDNQPDPSLSPASSRPASSIASHSDLPSECVDSEDDTHCEDNKENSDDEATPEVSPVNAWPPSNCVQAAV
ncbi:uncharacterized protein [Macrobrachium rosenbergii]|uniref:uncharacterized protein n=1 Tax=Macrobrachium rosenbergii TaxID=79674 RepID=UPI0034D70E56